MKTLPLIRQHDRIREVIKRGKALPDLELQAHLGRYACVLVAGLAENAVSELYGEYCSRRAQPAIAHFAQRHLDRYLNPKAARIVEVAGFFSQSWADDLKAFFSIEGRGDALDSIMSNRHLIAHGGMPSITLVRVDEYLTKVVQLLDLIEVQCGI